MESNLINWMQKHKELQDSHLELLREHQQLKARCDMMKAALEWIKTYGPDQSATGRTFIEKALKERESNTPAAAKEIEYMPILSAELGELRAFSNVPVRVPMHLLNEEQADRNHGQTLKRLKERGGVGIKEALSLMTWKNWSYYRDLPMKEALAMLNDLIANNNPH